MKFYIILFSVLLLSQISNAANVEREKPYNNYENCMKQCDNVNGKVDRNLKIASKDNLTLEATNANTVAERWYLAINNSCLQKCLELFKKEFNKNQN